MPQLLSADPPCDYLVGDYLAELTMAILVRGAPIDLGESFPIGLRFLKKSTTTIQPRTRR